MKDLSTRIEKELLKMAIAVLDLPKTYLSRSKPIDDTKQQLLALFNEIGEGVIGAGEGEDGYDTDGIEHTSAEAVFRNELRATQRATLKKLTRSE